MSYEHTGSSDERAAAATGDVATCAAELRRYTTHDLQQSPSSPYIYSAEGSLPLVITSAHGGVMKPEAIPDRTYGVLTPDLGTLPLALRIAESVSNCCGGKRPFLVVSLLSRRKVDPNRQCTKEATSKCEASRDAYDAFHQCVEESCELATHCLQEASQRKALLIDIHGHGHIDDWIEIGHLIKGSILKKADLELPSPGAEWVRGDKSFGSYLVESSRARRSTEYKVVPSPSIPHPGNKKYFSGGYITRRYRRDGVRTMQLEYPSCYRGEHSKESAPIIADALVRFMNAWGYIADEYMVHSGNSSEMQSRGIKTI